MNVQSNENAIIDNCITYTVENIRHYPFHVSKNLQVLYVLSGSIKVVNVSGSTILKEDGIECININEPTQITSLTTDNIVLIMEINYDYLCHINPNIDKIILNVNGIQFFPACERHKTKENITNTKKLKDMFMDLTWSYIKRPLSQKTLKNLKYFCNFIIEHFDDVKKHLNCFPHVNEHILQRFRRIDYYIQGNLSKRIQLDHLVEREFLSPQYISSEITEKYRRSFLSIIEYYRTIKAVRLLINNPSVKGYDIIQHCGFSDSKYFYRAFRKHMGYTPTDFKERLIRDGKTVLTTFMNIQSDDIIKRIQQVKSHQIAESSFSSIIDDGKSWSKMQHGHYVSDVEKVNFLQQYYSLFTAHDKQSITLTQDEIWLYHSGSPMILYVENKKGDRSIHLLVSHIKEKDYQTPILSLSKGDIVHIQPRDKAHETLISRLFL